MTKPKPISQPIIIQMLNETTAQAQHVLGLFRQEKVPLPWPGSLALVNLLVWAEEQDMVADPAWLRAVVDAAVKAEAGDPRVTHDNLETPALLRATTLRDAAIALMQHVVDLIPPGTQPA